jgi:5-methylthioadenosine/S-adenosylhomocysteine deaminase
VRSPGRLMLRGGTVLTMDSKIGDLEVGDVFVEDGTIVAVDRHLEADAEVLDCAGKIVLPGFVNSHLHMFQTALRSYWSDALAIDYFTQSRLGEKAIFHQYTPEDVYWGQFAGALENLAAGTTTVVDTSQCSYTPEHTDAALEGISRSGIRCVFSFSPAIGDHVQAATYAHPQDIHRLIGEINTERQSRINLAMGYLVDAEAFRLARELDLPVFAHVNDHHWGQALEALEADSLLGPHATYIHCLDLEDSTWEAIARTGGKVSVSVIVEQTLGMGLPALRPAIDRGVPASFGTDAVSTGPVDLFSQMRAAYTLQRSGMRASGGLDESGAGGPLSTRDILRMATLGGAQAAHVDDLVGSLTPGKRADVVVLDGRALNAAPVTHATGAVVQCMDTGNVETVLVDGQVVKSGGQLVGVDVEEAIDRLAQSAEGLLRRSGSPDILLTSCR